MEWKTVKLGDYIEDIAAGPFGSNLKVECFVSDGFPIIDGANLKGFVVTDNITKFVTEEKARSLHRAIATRGEVVVTISGNVGQIAYIPKDSKYKEYLVSQRQFRVRFNNEVDIKYLIYYFHSYEGQHKILSFANQTGVPALAQPLKNFRNIEMDLPSLADQRRIAAILSALDDKIENNNRINANLEAQAQALFKSWFVDFEPWGGVMPKDWKEGVLGELCSTNKRTYKGTFSHIIEYVDTGSVTKNRIESVQILNPNVDKIPSRARRFVTEGDILFSSVRPNQNHYMFLYNPASNMVASTGFVVITANRSAFRYYIYQYIIQEEIINHLQAIAEQSVSTYPSINASDITNLEILIPSDKVIDEYAKIMVQIMAQIDANNRENQRLAALRDTLLPKLMKGEIAL